MRLLVMQCLITLNSLACGHSLIGADLLTAEPTALQVDLAGSKTYIKVTSSTRLGHDHGVVGNLRSGSLTLGGAGELVFDMRSYIADKPEARAYVGLTAKISDSDARKTSETMLGKDVLAVSQYPTAKYMIKSCVPSDGQPAGRPGKYQVEGEFTLRGVTKKVPIVAVIENTDVPSVLRMKCAFPISQTHFGMKPYKALGGLVGVNDRLEIWGDLVLRPVATDASPTSNSGR